jgi:isoleucyl-tRNA synthetase
MPLSLNEIREHARAFAKEWAGESSERAEAQSVWNDFFNVFGVNRRRDAFLFQRYQALTSLLPSDTPKKSARKRT